MKKNFFDHIVEVDTLHVHIESMDMEPHEKDDIKRIVNDSLYHTILDAILSELSEEDKKVFLSHVVEDNHDKIWGLLNDKIENVEIKIKSAAEVVKKELHEEIRSSKSA